MKTNLLVDGIPRANKVPVQISGLKLNKMKAKALWIGSSKCIISQIWNFQCVKEPIKNLVHVKKK